MSDLDDRSVWGLLGPWQDPNYRLQASDFRPFRTIPAERNHVYLLDTVVRADVEHTWIGAALLRGLLHYS